MMHDRFVGTILAGIDKRTTIRTDLERIDPTK